ncbi:MAG TPA: tetratricopeptide repeat protein [Thermoanaerobaculia bacterium]|nr:tetratricopeptide repeat protein [Thermoanaerobaculia bacterium]
MTHYDDEALFEYVEGMSPVAADIESHVSACGRCSTEVGEQREMIAGLGQKDVWESGPVPAPRKFVLNVAAFAERARQEDERATVLCDEILTGPSAWWRQRLRTSDGVQTAGMVKQLLERWRPMVQSSPPNALQVTALAIELANAIDIAEYPCDYVVKLRAQAFRDHAWVLSFMGRHPEALDFVDHAKRLFEQVPLPEYDLARVATVKALILHAVDRKTEAVELAREAAATFLRFGDRTRYLNAKIAEGISLYENGAVSHALEVWTSIDGDPALDEANAVQIRHNLAICYADLGQPDRALEHVQSCIAHFEFLGMDVARTRSRWLMGRALVACGRQQDAIPVLRAAWQEFQHFEMTGDAGLVALELAEALLLRGEADEVPAICREVITQFTRAGMASRALTALSFLREAVAIGQASPDLVRHVHAFLRKLPAEQPRLFAPPPRGAGE